MQSFGFAATLSDSNMNKYLRGIAHGRCFGEKAMKAMLKWFGHVGRDNEDKGKRMQRERTTK